MAMVALLQHLRGGWMNKQPQPLELDVRMYPPRQRCAVALRTFDALAPGQAMVVRSDTDPKSILFQLQEQRTLSFDWSVLRDGPADYRVEVRRRPSQGPSGVAEYLSWDHQRLDAILLEVRRSLEKRSCAETLPRFADFRCGLGRHIEMEEQILLPAFESVTGVAGNPMAVVYTEHELAHRACEDVEAALRAGDRPGALLQVESLREMLLLHNLKEERLLYPTSDRLAGGDRERVDLVRWMQAI
ncbi:MAG TPA: DUF2249 domain-containing protein [Polyangia bacterium]|jgi:uncharacterized protein (DUF2249 family)